jgi:hypothetical protein
MLPGPARLTPASKPPADVLATQDWPARAERADALRMNPSIPSPCKRVRKGKLDGLPSTTPWMYL